MALDKVQKETCTIGEATEIRLNLSHIITEEFTEFEINCFKNRFNMAMTPPHYLPNLSDRNGYSANL